MAAGDPIYALDTPPSVGDLEFADELAYSSTTFGPGGTPVGTTFIAPTSGVVLLLWHARFESNTAGANALVSVSLRTGGTLGSGTVVSGANDESALEVTGTARLQAGMHRRVPGLTPGDTYNVRVEHKMLTAGNGDQFTRSVDVVPLLG